MPFTTNSLSSFGNINRSNRGLNRFERLSEGMNEYVEDYNFHKKYEFNLFGCAIGRHIINRTEFGERPLDLDFYKCNTDVSDKMSDYHKHLSQNEKSA